jgi:hypothetical protein
MTVIGPQVLAARSHDEALKEMLKCWPTITPWQWAVIWETIRDGDSEVRGKISDFTFNATFGMRASFGRQRGHSTLAAVLLTLPKSVLVVPTEIHRARMIKLLESMNRKGDGERVWTSRPLDVVPILETDLTREDLLSRNFPPFTGAEICVVDDSGLLSQDELRLLRSISWDRYLELA